MLECDLYAEGASKVTLLLKTDYIILQLEEAIEIIMPITFQMREFRLKRSLSQKTTQLVSSRMKPGLKFPDIQQCSSLQDDPISLGSIKFLSKQDLHKW